MSDPVSTYRRRNPVGVAALIRGLHPLLKQKIRPALHAIQQDPLCGKVLREELAGLRSYRVARFRAVYRVADHTTVEIIAVGPRRNIYEETSRRLQREPP
ncbi:MAG TPA: type II toxin-antitoxin system RelE/ParE family toxin [Deferrisomatales bacterium]|nr:type II toxin-antitoxin system RelE/ParE family toxin [Deferrisomatales bacterium]